MPSSVLGGPEWPATCHDKLSPIVRKRALSGGVELPPLKKQHAEVFRYPGSDQRPWHQHDRVLRKLDEGEYRALVEPSGPLSIDLDNSIHPLFYTLARIHECLHPTLRLASRFLTTPSLLPFWHNLLTSPRQPLPEESAQFRYPLHVIPADFTPLTRDQVEFTHEALLRVAQHVRLRFTQDKQRMTTTHAFCSRIKDPHGTTFLWPEIWAGQPRGNWSEIDLHPDYLRVLHPFGKHSDVQRMRASFSMAVTLCHEFAHAVGHYRYPCADEDWKKEFEPFFGNCRKAELGRSWEACILGGAIHQLAWGNEFKHSVFWMRWPDSQEQWVRPKEGAQPLPLSRARTVPPKWETWYIVPLWVLEQTFQTAFWDDKVSQQGTQAFYFTKELGVRMRNWDWPQGDDLGFESDCSSPERGADHNNVVRPGQPLIPSAEASDSDVSMNSFA